MISVSYHSVHQAFQLALAAEEAELLDTFYCSFYDAPGKLGHLLKCLLGEDTLKNRRLDGLPTKKIIEYPWPELSYKLKQRLCKLPSNAWISAAHRFDKWASRQIKTTESHIIVGTENCAYHAFKIAKKRGLTCIYDSPGYNAKLCRAITEEAAKRTNLPPPSIADTSEITRRKESELSHADMVLTYSEFHADGVFKAGIPRSKIAIIPLWTDSTFWTPTLEKPIRKQSQKLKLLYAGGINLRKGIPFLIEAVRNLSHAATLTLVGSLDPDAEPCLRDCDNFINVLQPTNKTKLRSIYQSHDLLILPSLGDSFGFVAMEAMACGLPVILSNNCGAPIPDAAWRVPVMDSKAIQERITYYLDQPDQLAIDGDRARIFASTYTPERYRKAIGHLYKQFV